MEISIFFFFLCPAPRENIPNEIKLINQCRVASVRFTRHSIASQNVHCNALLYIRALCWHYAASLTLFFSVSIRIKNKRFTYNLKCTSVSVCIDKTPLYFMHILNQFQRGNISTTKVTLLYRYVDVSWCWLERSLLTPPTFSFLLFFCFLLKTDNKRWRNAQ